MTKKRQQIGDIELLDTADRQGRIVWDVYLGKNEGMEVSRDNTEQVLAEILSKVVKIEALLRKRK